MILLQKNKGMSFISKFLFIYFLSFYIFLPFAFPTQRNVEIVNNAWNSENKIRNENEQMANKGIFQFKYRNLEN